MTELTAYIKKSTCFSEIQVKSFQSILALHTCIQVEHALYTEKTKVKDTMALWATLPLDPLLHAAHTSRNTHRWAGR
jgi:hypothetical protein